MASVTKFPRKLADGSNGDRWVVRYVDPATGKRPSKAFELKKLADAYCRKVEREIENGDHIAAADSRTMQDAAKLFLANIDARVLVGAMRPCSGRNYHFAFSRSILPTLGTKLMKDVTCEDMEGWYHGLVRSGRMQPDTAARRLWFVQALFAFGISRRWTTRNPAAEAAKAIGKPQTREIETFTADDVRRLVLAANDKRWRGQDRSRRMLCCAVNLAAFSGLRWGEIFGLTGAALDLEHSALHVRKSLDGLGNLQPPKTRAGNRTVVLPSHVVELLAEFVRDYPPENAMGLVFSSESGRPMAATNFRNCAWRPLQKRAGIAAPSGKPVRFHALRHFAISWMIDNGWPVVDVAAAVGHADVAMTLNVYAHVVKTRRQTAAAVQLLAEKLLAPTPGTDGGVQPGAARLTHDYASI